VQRRRHSGHRLAAAGFVVLVWLAGLAAAPQATAEDDRVLGFRLDDLDASGLIGDAGAKRALDYEFCIPADPLAAAEVMAADPSARIMRESPGRIGCRPDQWLVVGSTHQPDFLEVLERLIALPYVERIEQTFYE